MLEEIHASSKIVPSKKNGTSGRESGSIESGVSQVHISWNSGFLSLFSTPAPDTVAQSSEKMLPPASLSWRDTVAFNLLDALRGSVVKQTNKQKKTTQQLLVYNSEFPTLV